MATDLSLNASGTLTLYVGGKKVMKGTLAQVTAYLGGPSAPAPKQPKKPKPQSRVQRWGDAASAAVSALETLVDLQTEFQEWKDNLPENLQQSALGEKLDAVCDLDLSSAQDTLGEAEGLDLPLGFGRD